ncbi:MAG: hypothetical protein C4523_05360 [Myxococcales bacterium]|nr:MAG: hypothetical protein C4523_05360 [Myxococcales bacterium]
MDNEDSAPPPDETRTASETAEPSRDKEGNDIRKLKSLLVQILLLGAPIAFEKLWEWAKNRKTKAAQ